MSTLINLREPNQDPLVLDISGLAVIKEFTADNVEQHLRVSIHADYQDRLEDVRTGQLDVDYIAEQAKDVGFDLFEIPFVWGDDKEMGRYFVNPALVQSVIASQFISEEGDEHPHNGLLVDVKGFGRVETYKVPQPVFDEFIKTVDTLNPNMMEITPDIAHTRWYRELMTKFDPAEIRSIQPNGMDIDARLKDGMRLDFSLNTKIVASDVTDEDVARLKANSEHMSRQNDAYLKSELESRKARENFAAVVAAHTPHLERIQNAADVYYFDMNSISSINLHGDDLIVQFHKTAMLPYRSEHTVFARFDNEQAAADELDRLMSLNDHNAPA